MYKNSFFYFRILSQPRTDFGVHACFFSLLRDLICEDADAKTSTMKVMGYLCFNRCSSHITIRKCKQAIVNLPCLCSWEEKVREWQDCAASSRNVWVNEQPSWVDVVSSALRFMSGDVIGKTEGTNHHKIIKTKDKCE